MSNIYVFDDGGKGVFGEPFVVGALFTAVWGKGACDLIVTQYPELEGSVSNRFSDTEFNEYFSIYKHVANDEKKERKHSHYFKDVKDLDEVDVYAVCEIFGIDDPSGCTQHAIKKLLLAGKRGGGKDFEKDHQEAIDTLVRRKVIKGVKQ